LAIAGIVTTLAALGSWAWRIGSAASTERSVGVSDAQTEVLLSVPLPVGMITVPVRMPPPLPGFARQEAPINPVLPGRPATETRFEEAAPSPVAIDRPPMIDRPTGATPLREESPRRSESNSQVVAPPSVPNMDAASRDPRAKVALQVPTYTASDLDVVPPIPESPQRLWRVPTTARREDLVMIDIIVNERGTVESARVQEQPSNLADALAVTMSLSAAKSWRFHPAMKDGLPVKYRQFISLTLR
jgi:hypothetical protein